MNTEADENPDSRRYGLRHALFSVLAAFFGVQSSANQARDEKHGSMGLFFVLGLLATIVLVALLWVSVLILMAQAR